MRFCGGIITSVTLLEAMTLILEISAADGFRDQAGVMEDAFAYIGQRLIQILASLWSSL